MPIPELRAPEADVGLVFLSANDINFEMPVDDDLFDAHREYQLLLDIAGGGSMFQKVYNRDEPMRVLGCVSRQQFCPAGATAGVG